VRILAISGRAVMTRGVGEAALEVLVIGAVRPRSWTIVHGGDGCGSGPLASTGGRATVRIDNPCKSTQSAEFVNFPGKWRGFFEAIWRD
jgi:hypothetical protein